MDTKISVNVHKGPVVRSEGELKDRLFFEVTIEGNLIEVKYDAEITLFEENHMDYFLMDEVSTPRYKNVYSFKVQELIDKTVDVAEDCLLDDEDEEISKQKIKNVVKQWLKKLKGV